MLLMLEPQMLHAPATATPSKASVAPQPPSLPFGTELNRYTFATAGTTLLSVIGILNFSRPTRAKARLPGGLQAVRY